jgi:hypothetical protein
MRELAAGLQQGDGSFHLITVHPDPSPTSSSTYLHGEGWLAFNSMQPWRYIELMYSMIAHDYGLEPVKPAVMAEGAYEQGTEYGFDVTPLWVRRQAYYSYLHTTATGTTTAGACFQRGKRLWMRLAPNRWAY